ncbi:hypothetical protein GCM10010199_40360 [Dactylosporangium roseum]
MNNPATQNPEKGPAMNGYMESRLTASAPFGLAAVSRSWRSRRDNLLVSGLLERSGRWRG